jgi:hypothetical protein
MSIGLTEKGNQYASNRMLNVDFGIVDKIKSEGRIWDRLIERGEFLSYVYEKFSHYLSSDPRAKFRGQEMLQERNTNSITNLDGKKR